MKKLIVFFLFLLLFSYPTFGLSNSDPNPIFSILDSQCIVVIQGSSIHSENFEELEVFVNTIGKTNIPIWYVKKDQYSKVKFPNNTYVDVENKINLSSGVYLYKHGRSYYEISLIDENMPAKVNRYFGMDIFPIFERRSKVLFAENDRGVIYVHHSPKELYNLSHGVFDESEYDVYIKSQEQLKTKLEVNMQILKIHYNEATGDVKTIRLTNRDIIDLEDKGGQVILYRKDKRPMTIPISSLDFTLIEEYFK